MELKHQLIPQLKQLRLSGILDSLEDRHQQALDGKWSYIDFLERLLQDEVERRAQKQLQLRLRRAAIDTTKTIETFDFKFNTTIDRQQILALASGDYIRNKRNVILCGPTGVPGLLPNFRFVLVQRQLSRRVVDERLLLGLDHAVANAVDDVGP